MSEILRFVLAALLMAAGIVTIVISILGVFRFRFVLNRMHCAAVIDTLGALLILSSLMVLSEAPVYLLKLIAIVAFLWIGSPVSSHIVCRTELLTDDDALKHTHAPEGTEEHEHDVL